MTPVLEVSFLYMIIVSCGFSLYTYYLSCLSLRSVLQTLHREEQPPQLERLQISSPESAPSCTQRQADNSKLMSCTLSVTLSKTSLLIVLGGIFCFTICGNTMKLVMSIVSIAGSSVLTMVSNNRSVKYMLWQIMMIQLQFYYKSTIQLCESVFMTALKYKKTLSLMINDHAIIYLNKYNFSVLNNNMASKYLQKYPVPAGFQEILADLTRQILRDQPPNIIEYAAKYFQMLEKGEKFEFNSKFNVSKDDKKYELAYNPKNAEDITKKASNIAAKVNDAGKPEKDKHAHRQPQSHKHEAVHAVSKPEPVPAKHEPVASKQESVAAKKSEQKKQAHPAQANADVLNKLPPEFIKEINKIFDQIDLNENGFIESKQIRAAVQALNQQMGSNEPLNEAEIKQFVTACDTNHDGRISRVQFANFMANMFSPLFMGGFENFSAQAEPAQIGTEKTVNQQEVETYMNEQGQNALEEQLRSNFNKIFNQLDVDQSGYLSSKEIKNAIQKFCDQSGGEVDDSQIQEFIRMVDENHDKKISREELFDFIVSLMSSEHGGFDEGEGEGEGEAEDEN